MQITTRSILALVALPVQSHRAVIFDSRWNFNILFDLLDENSCRFAFITRVFNHQSYTFTSDTLQMHYNWVLSVNSSPWPTTCQTPCRSCAWFTLITMTSLTGCFFFVLQCYFRPFHCVYKIQFNSSHNIFSFSLFRGPLSVSLVVGAWFVFKNVVVKLVERVLVESLRPTCVSITTACSLVIVLPLFVFIR